MFRNAGCRRRRLNGCRTGRVGGIQVVFMGQYSLPHSSFCHLYLECLRNTNHKGFMIDYFCIYLLIPKLCINDLSIIHLPPSRHNENHSHRLHRHHRQCSAPAVPPKRLHNLNHRPLTPSTFPSLLISKAKSDNSHRFSHLSR